MKLLLITIALLGLAFAGIAIKIWAKKDGEFAGTCSSGNANLKARGVSCACGGDGECQNNNEESHDHVHTTPIIDVKKIS
ncbi:MAG: membrane or secreted protein [Bacteroidota bacterium]